MPPKQQQQQEHKNEDNYKYAKLPNTFDGTPSELQSFLFDCNAHALDDDIPKKKQTRMILAALRGPAHALAMTATEHGTKLDDPKVILDALKDQIPVGSVLEEARTTFDSIKQHQGESAAAFLTRFVNSLSNYERASGAALPILTRVDELKRRLLPAYREEVLRTPVPPTAQHRNATWYANVCAALRRLDDVMRLRAPTAPLISAVTDNVYPEDTFWHVNAVRNHRPHRKFTDKYNPATPCPTCGRPDDTSKERFSRWCHLHGACRHDTDHCSELQRLRRDYQQHDSKHVSFRH